MKTKEQIDRKKEYDRQYGKEYYKKHRSRKLTRANARSHLVYIQKKMELVYVFGGRCIRCGFSDIRALQFDHINGGGKAQRRKNPMNPVQYLNYVQEKGTEIFQLLCANCNWIKRYENSENKRR